MKKLLWAIVIFLAGFAVYHRLQAPPGAPDPAAMGPAPVTAALVVAREAQEFRDYSGRLHAVAMAEIRPRIDGVIEAVHFEEGAPVKKGDLLFTIDPRPLEAEVKRAEAALRAAEAQAAYAEKDRARAAPLMKDSYIAKRDYDARRNSAEVAAAALESAEAGVHTAHLNLDYARIRAPIDGRVSRAEITPGNLVQSVPNAPLLTVIVAMTPVYADFDMDEAAYLSYVQAGLNANDKAGNIPVLVEPADGKSAPHRGFVTSFDNRIDPQSGTMRVRAQLDNPGGALIPGMFVRVKIAAPRQGAVLLIADRAVGTDQDKKIVQVIGKDNIPAPRVITLGGIADGLRIVTSGLKEGEMIVVNGLQRVMPGAPVAPALVDMDKAAGDDDAPPDHAAAR